MSSGNIRVLIINRQLGFSVRIKQALEQLGGFEVAPFTSADTALEYLQGHRQDVALVDFSIPNVSGSDLVYTMRQIQPGIPIIASPDAPDVVAEARGLKVSSIVDVPIGARELKPILEEAVRTASSSPVLDTQEVPVALDEDTTSMESVYDPPAVDSTGSADDSASLVDSEPLELSDAQSDSGTIEFILKDDVSALQEQFDEEPQDTTDEDSERAVEVFQRLVEEEPPMPTLEETGTVGDLKTGVTSANLYELAESLMDSRPRPTDDNYDEPEEVDSTLVRSILESTRSPDAPKPSLDELLSNIEHQFPEDAGGVRPLPSWVKDVERYVREPDFLDEALPEIEDEPSSSTTTMIDDDELEQATGANADVQSSLEMPQDVVSSHVDDALFSQESAFADDVTPDEDVNPESDLDFEPSEEPEFSSESPWVAEVVSEDEDSEEVDEFLFAESQDAVLEIDQFAPEPEVDEALSETAPQASLDTVEPEDEDEELEPERVPTSDPELAQMALSLTQASLESTAAAILLAKDREVIAYSGDLPLDDVAKLHDVVAGDWDANPGEARVRFTSLPDTGQDYMLYSRRTEGDFTLSLVFEGTLPLRIIRQQSDKILDALVAVPEDEDEQVVEEQAEVEDLFALEEVAAQEEDVALESTQELLRSKGEEPEIKPDLELAADLALKAVPTPEQLVRYTYIWMLRDTTRSLSRESAQALVVRLDEWLTSLGWNVEILQVYEDYIYLMGDVPDDQPVQDIIFELKEFSARIVSQFEAVDDIYTLWADSYGFLTPGRQLTQDEVQEFINFERA